MILLAGNHGNWKQWSKVIQWISGQSRLMGSPLTISKLCGFGNKRDWKKLNTEGAVDKCYKDQEAVELFRKALEHKGVKKYSADVRKNLTLLIDANPIESASGFIAGIEDMIRYHAQVGYKSVWVVGTGDSYKVD